MQNAVTLLEKARVQRGVGQTEFVNLLRQETSLSTLNQGYYSGVMTGKNQIPESWRKEIAKFLNVPIDQLEWRKDGGTAAPCPMCQRKFSARELRELSKIAERFGQPLTIETLLRVATEIKTAGSS